jgi:hypothetical protein
MTADEARAIEGMFGRLEGFTPRNNYPVTIYGRVVKVDSYWMYFEVNEEEPVLFSLRKVTFTPLVRRNKIVKPPVKHLAKLYPKNK